MAEIEKIEKIKKVKGTEKTEKIAALEEELKRVGPNKDHFDRLMIEQQNRPKVKPEEKIEGSKRNSPIEELRTLHTTSIKTRVTPVELIAQTQEAINKMEEIKGTLKTPDIKVKESLTPLLDNKLQHVDENLRAAMTKTGSEYIPRAVVPEVNPISRFLGFLTDGQHKLQTIALDVERMHLNKEDINPAALLAIQIKVGYITQELEFFTGLLNKALESTKTIMNVQV